MFSFRKYFLKMPAAEGPGSAGKIKTEKNNKKNGPEGI
jgi:hypothetical protein